MIICARAPLRGRLTPPATLAQGRTQLYVKGAEIKKPWFRATSDLIMPRATCEELIALCFVVCLLEMPRSDRQYGCNLQKKTKKRTEREDTSTKKAKRRVRTYIPVPGTSNDTWCCVFERKHSAEQQSTAPQGRHDTAWHRTAPHGAALGAAEQ